MSAPEIARSWEDRYRSGEFGFREPDAFVQMVHAQYLTPLLPAGSTGLDLAGGAGHHALWLAAQGWRMTLADIAPTALTMAQQHAAQQGLSDITYVQMSAEALVEACRREGRTFDFLLISFFLDRPLLPLLPQMLAPGGLLLYRTYTEDNLRLGNPRGPRDPDHLLRSQELLEEFRAMKIFHYNETALHKGVVEFIGQRVVA